MAFMQGFETSISTKLLGEEDKNADLLGLHEEAKSPPQAPAKWYQIAYYQPYFQVNTRTALSRLRKSVYRLGANSFFGKSGPDLYCPFWIITTLIICVNISGNAAAYFASADEQEWVSGIRKVSTAASMLYGIAFFVPLTCHCVLKRFHSHMSFIELLSLYGYSWFLFIPASLIGMFPDKLIRMTVLLSVASWSYMLLVRNILREAVDAPLKMKCWLAAVSLSGHAIFVLSCLFYFYA